jgi:hypothetical protein
MRNIDGSEWMRNPDLEIVQSATGGSGFTLYAEQVSTVSEDAAKGSAPRNGTAKKLARAGGNK